MAKGDALDPKGLIEEAYKIDGIAASECRSIFLDWALSSKDEPRAGIQALLVKHAAEPNDHPMSVVLREGLESAAPPKRRGGRRARVPE